LKYFFVTDVCFTVLPTFGKIAIQESSVLFASMLSHFMVGFCFLIVLVRTKEWGLLRNISSIQKRAFFAGVIVMGLIHFSENGSINLAMSQAPVAQVFAIKRLMPFFAFLIGFLYFKERDNLPKKIAATALMVAGAIATILL
jgi:uncharacterized membrane protein